MQSSTNFIILAQVEANNGVLNDETVNDSSAMKVGGEASNVAFDDEPGHDVAVAKVKAVSISMCHLLCILIGLT